jgi:hypothetical protein
MFNFKDIWKLALKIIFLLFFMFLICWRFEREKFNFIVFGKSVNVLNVRAGVAAGAVGAGVAAGAVGAGVAAGAVGAGVAAGAVGAGASDEVAPWGSGST